MPLSPGLRVLDLRLAVGAEMPRTAWAGQLWPPLFSLGMVKPGTDLQCFHSKKIWGFSSKNSFKTKSFYKIPKVCKMVYSVPTWAVNIIFFLYVKVMTLLGTKVPISRDCSFPLASLSKLTSVGPVFQGQGTAVPSGRRPSWPFRNLESVLFRM